MDGACARPHPDRRRLAAVRHPARANHHRVTVPPLSSLRTRLLLAVVAAITPFVIYAALTAAADRAMAGVTVRDQSLGRARSAARHADEQVKRVRDAIEASVVRVQQRVDSTSVGNIPLDVDSLTQPLATAVSIALLDSSGQRVALLLGAGGRIDAIPLIRRRALASTAALRARIRPDSARDIVIDEGSARNPDDSAAVIFVRALARPLVPCRCLGDIDGALVAVLSDGSLQDMLGVDSLPEGAVATLLGSNGQLLGRMQSPERWTREDFDASVLTASGERDGALDLKGDDDVVRVVGFSSMKQLPWRAYVGLRKSAAGMSFDSRLRDTVLLTIVSLLIAFFGVLMAWQAFGRSMATLIGDTARLATGALSHRTEVAREAGEVGKLGAAVNTLAAELEGRRRLLQDEARRGMVVFEESPVAMWIADASVRGVNAGRIRQANAAAARLLGVSGPGALVGQKDSELLDTDGVALVEPGDAHDDGTVPEARAGRATVATADGTRRTCTVTVVHAKQETLPIRIVTVQDTATPAYAAPAGAATALSDQPLAMFARTVADDFRGLFMGMSGFSQLALETANDPEMRKVALDRLNELSSLGLALSERIRHYVRPDSLSLDIIDANEALGEALETVQPTLGTRIELETRCDVAPAAVRADSALFIEVASALITNAGDSMPRGGKVTVATGRVVVPTDPGERTYPVEPGSYIVLTIADTGRGMTDEARARMFEPFYSTKLQQGFGTGMSLAAVAGIAKVHGWVIDVQTKHLVGTLITLYMPEAPPGAAAVPAAATQVSLDTTPSVSE